MYVQAVELTSTSGGDGERVTTDGSHMWTGVERREKEGGRKEGRKEGRKQAGRG
jgi:hypothetical protein